MDSRLLARQRRREAQVDLGEGAETSTRGACAPRIYRQRDEARRAVPSCSQAPTFLAIWKRERRTSKFSGFRMRIGNGLRCGLRKTGASCLTEVVRRRGLALAHPELLEPGDGTIERVRARLHEFRRHGVYHIIREKRLWCWRFLMAAVIRGCCASA